MRVEIAHNKLRYDRNFPTSWDQVNYGQFLDLTDCVTDEVKIFTVFTGIPADIIKKAKITGLDSVIAVLGFLRTPPVEILPKTILGYPLPADLGFETLDQYTDLKDDLDKSGELKGKDALVKYPLYCAIYACKAKYGEYDWKLAESMADEFLKAPAPEVLAIGNFTLAKLIGLNLSIDPGSRKKITRMRRYRLVLKAWALNMVTTVRSNLWPKRTIQQ